MKRRELASRIMGDPKFQDRPGMREEDIEMMAQKRDEALASRLQASIYDWKPITYLHTEKCLSYCSARLAQDFAISLRVFQEIRRRDPDFRPESILDFGSGVGCSFWVLQEVWKGIKEFVLVDTSGVMNNLAHLLIKVRLHFIIFISLSSLTSCLI